MPTIRLRPVLVAATAGLCAVAIWSASESLPLLDLPRDTVIEDWARNFLDTATSGDKPAFALTDGDTEFFAVRYVQAVDGDRDVVVFGLGNAFNVRTLRKVATLRPGFAFDEQAITTSDSRGIVRMMVEPNMDTFDFTHAFHFTTPRAKTIFYPVGRRLVRGEGEAFAQTSVPLRLNPPVYDVDNPSNENMQLYSEYADYYLAQGRYAVGQGRVADAIAHYREGLNVVPWCRPCLVSACQLEASVGKAGENCDAIGQ